MSRLSAISGMLSELTLLGVAAMIPLFAGGPISPLEGTFAAPTPDLRYRISEDNGSTWSPWQNDSSESFSIGNIKPGASGTVLYELGNQGSEDGELDLTDVSVANFENGCADPETEADGSCSGPADGELGVSIELDVDLASTSVHDGLLDDFTGDFNVGEPLAAGTTKTLSIDWTTIDWSAAGRSPNEIQGDSAELDMTFVLTQTGP